MANPLYGRTEVITLNDGRRVEVPVEGSASKTIAIQKCRCCGKERPYESVGDFMAY